MTKGTKVWWDGDECFIDVPEAKHVYRVEIEPTNKTSLALVSADDRCQAAALVREIGYFVREVKLLG